MFNHPNLRPAFNQARIRQEDTQARFNLNDSDDNESREIDSSDVFLPLNSLGLNIRRPRILPFTRLDANNNMNFDDYEALLNLDDNIVQSVP